MKEEELKKIIPASKDKDVKYILQIIWVKASPEKTRAL